MNIFLSDVYAKRPYRVSKDTNGGFGTGSDFGRGIFTSLLSRLKRYASHFPPLSLPYAASILREKGHHVRYGRTCMPPSDTDLVLMPTSIVEHTTELAWAGRFKQAGFTVGFMGPFAAVVPNAYLAQGDFIIGGYPEDFLLDHALTGQEEGLLAIPAQNSTEDLPLPAWDIIPAQERSYRLFGSGGAFFPVLGSRGCPYACRHYCTYPLHQGGRVRYRSVANLVDELSYLQHRFGAGTILFRDPIFTFDRARTLALMDAMRENEIEMSFVIETHVRHLDDELLQSLRSAGCAAIKVGIESPHDQVLKKYGRRTTADSEQRQIVRRIEAHGMKAICFFMLAFPDDTWESSVETIRYARDLGSSAAQFSVVTPYPGTGFYESLKDRITASSFDQFTQFSLVYEHAHLSAARVEELKELAYRSFYLRPRFIVQHLRHIFLKGRRA
jgi:anaerobic magnesium-protoporphyrin IX monomethyl ester cyclase